MNDRRALELVALWNALFSDAHRTIAEIGGNEPLYLPPTPTSHGRIVCNRDYPASALHEIAHWCIASPRRRKLVDYGYEYLAPPRDADAQRRFFDAEERNQALESLFAAAAGLEFRVSVDDVGADLASASTFATRVAARAARLERDGLRPDVERYRTALRRTYRGG
jgi:elongation factor P hydroxylase